MKKILFGITSALIVGWFSHGLFSADQKSVQSEEAVQEKMLGTIALPEAGVTPQETRDIEETIAPVPKPVEETIEEGLIENVPFTVQAPFGAWSDSLFQNGCEEASLVMVAHWLSGKPLSKEVAKQEIIALSQFEKKWLGHSIDTSAEDTLKLLQDYYGVTSGEVRADIALADIHKALVVGSIVIVPADGRKLKNPHFTQPGPPRHMLVVIGYDAKTREFVTNDPGTKHGAGYRYPEKVLYDAILDYPTGDHLPVTSARKVMITAGKL